MSVAARGETPPLDAQSLATLELVAEQAGLAIAREQLNRQVARNDDLAAAGARHGVYRGGRAGV